MDILKKSCIIKEKGSKFSGLLIKLLSENDIKETVNAIKKEKGFTKGNHYIYAYKIKDRMGKNDDGESGAGKILVEQLSHSKIDNVLLAVVRWYGGKHLGSRRFKIIKNIALELLSSPI